FEEEFCGLVEKWAPRQFGASTNFHQAAFHQVLQDAFDRDAAHRFNVGPSDWLTISDDGESFQCGRRKPRRFRLWEKLTYPARAIGMTDQLPAASFFHELESTRRQSVIGFQLADGSRHFCFLHATEFIWNQFVVV